MRKVSQYALIIVGCINILNFLVICSFQFLIDESPEPYRLESPQNILVFAAHQDDCVISAGGLGIQNTGLGGQTTIVYLTRVKKDSIAEARQNESYKAWGLLDENIQLIFMDLIEPKDFSDDEINKSKQVIAEIISELDPTLVVVPLREGGHSDHDTLNKWVSNVVAEKFKMLNVLQAAEYNSYLSVEEHPSKVFWFLARLAPKIPFLTPNSGLNVGNQSVLDMTEAEQELKNNMLLQFESQKNIIPLYQFGYPDLFDKSKTFEGFTKTVLGKHMTIWTILTIGLFSMFIFIAGITISLKGKAWSLLITTIALTLVISSNRHFWKEDYIYVIIISAGFIVGHFLYFLKKFTIRRQ